MGHSLSKKAGYIAFGQGLAAISSIIAGAILSRYLTKETYGTYRQLWLVYNTLCPLITLGIPTSVNYFVPQLKKSEQSTFNLQTFVILTAGGAILSTLFFLGAPIIANFFHNPALMPVAQLFALIPVFVLPTLYYKNIFICLNRPFLVASLSAGLAVGRLFAVGVPAIMGYGLNGVLIGLLVFSSLQLAIVASLIFKTLGIRFSGWSFNLLQRQLRYALPLGLASIVGTLTLQLDKIVISSFFSASQYAVYVNGAIEIPLIGIVTSSVMAVLMPEFVRLNADGRLKHLLVLWHSAIRKVALIILPTMVFLLIYAPEFLTLLFSAKYTDSATIFRVYLLALPNRITTFGTILLSLGFSGLVMRYSVFALLLNLGLNYLFVNTVGFIGPAIGTVIAIYFINYLQLQKIASLMSDRLGSIFPWHILGEIALLVLLAGIVSSWPKLFCSDLSALSTLICGALSYVVFFIVVSVWSGLLRKQEIRNILEEVFWILK